MAKKNVLITGADGYIGRKLVAAMATRRDQFGRIAATDIREVPATRRQPEVHYEAVDVRDARLPALCREIDADVVVHLAAIVSPAPDMTREFLHSVEVVGTRNVLEACAAAKVDRIVVTSSGAAYGYYADNPAWLDEKDAIRGNPEFAYSDHKRQVEEMLARWRRDHPELGQIVFRPGTILGNGTRNQITAMFEKPWVLGLSGVAIPFVLIWDEDVVGALVAGILGSGTGIFNMAGDGTLTLRQMAKMMRKPYVPLPVGAIRRGLGVLKRFGLTRYGPEQLDFLRYRPVLANQRLKEEFGYVPQKTTREVFEHYLATR